MSFIQKSVWVQLLITLFISIYYGSELAHLYSTEQLSDDSFTSLLLSAAVQLLLLNIVIYSIVAALSNKEDVEQDSDERDVLIGLKGSNIAYSILSAWVVAMVVSLWATPLDNTYYYIDTLSGAFNILNVLLVGFLVAEIARFTCKLYYYHKGM